jgi:hypothetical protein
MDFLEGGEVEWGALADWDMGLGLDVDSSQQAGCWDAAAAVADPDTSLSLNQSQAREEEPIEQACRQATKERARKRRRAAVKRKKAPPRPAPPPRQAVRTAVMTTPPHAVNPRPSLVPTTVVMTSTRVPDAPIWPGTYVIGATGRLRLLTPSPTYGRIGSHFLAPPFRQ